MSQTITSKELNSQIQELAEFTVDQLLDMSVQSLRRRLSQCRVSYIDRDGAKVQVTRARKDELVKAVQDLTQPTKVLHSIVPDFTGEQLENLLATASNLDEATETELGTLAASVYTDLRDYTKRQWNAKEQRFEPPTLDLASIAFRVTNTLAASKLTAETQLRYRAHVLKAMGKMMEVDKGEWYFKGLQAYFEAFRQQAYLQMKEAQVIKKQRDATHLRERKGTQSIVNIAGMLEHAVTVLEGLNSETPKTAWLDISIALSLVTGRRSAEIHASAQFEEVDEWHVAFTGQLKTKGRSAEHYAENPTYTIPTLAPASLVVKGLEWLTYNGKRADTPEVAHKRYSKELGLRVKYWQRKYSTTEMGEEKAFTVHNLRQFYNLVAVEIFKPQTKHRVPYSASILGHGLDDETTPQRYDADYVLSLESVPEYLRDVPRDEV